MNRHKKAYGGEGNTEPLPQPTRKTFYCFTVFDLNEDAEKEFNRQLGMLCLKYLYGKEKCPTTGRTHFQGFMHLKKSMRITELKLIGKPHLEACKGSEEQNIKYCSKDGNVVRYGFPKPIQSPDMWQVHLQWIKSHPNFIPREGNSIDNTSTGKGRIIPYIESMTCLYTDPMIHQCAKRWLDDDIKLHASIKQRLYDYEHATIY